MMLSASKLTKMSVDIHRLCLRAVFLAKEGVQALENETDLAKYENQNPKKSSVNTLSNVFNGKKKTVSG